MMTSMNDEMKKPIDENQPWYKQWMVWMVIAPPLTAVIAGIITINIAIESDDGLVVDDYYKEGLGINQSLQRDQLARDLDLKATVFIDNLSLKLRFEKAMNDQSLSLHFIHPTQSQRDIELTVQRFTEDAYQVALPQMLNGNWNVLLEPIDKSWRISGRIDFSVATSVQLLPNLK